MADYRSDLLSFEAVLDRALLTASFPRLHEHVMLDPHAPSAIRVLAKSLHMLAAGWIASIAWLWLAALQQHVLRHGMAPDDYAVPTVVAGLIPAVAMALIGAAIAKWAGRAPNKFLQRREWVHAFWWSAVPNALLLITVWVMIQEGR
jgi:hypothetical protein